VLNIVHINFILTRYEVKISLHLSYEIYMYLSPDKILLISVTFT